MKKLIIDYPVNLMTALSRVEELLIVRERQIEKEGIHIEDDEIYLELLTEEKRLLKIKENTIPTSYKIVEV